MPHLTTTPRTKTSTNFSRVSAFFAGFFVALIVSLAIVPAARSASEAAPPPPVATGSVPTLDLIPAQHSLTLYHQHRADKWAHLRLAHLLSAHVPLPVLKDLGHERHRTRIWIRRESEQRALTLRWRYNMTHLTVKGHRASRVQVSNLTRCLAVAKHMKTPNTVRVAMVMGIIQESSAYNKPFGTGSSVGLLQLIDSHGSIQWRMVPENSCGWFLRGAMKVYHPGIAPGSLAQRVEASAFPDAYNQWHREAVRIVQVL